MSLNGTVKSESLEMFKTFLKRIHYTVGNGKFNEK